MKIIKRINKLSKKIMGILFAMLIFVSSFPLDVVHATWSFDDPFDDTLEKLDEAADEADIPDLSETLEDFIIETEKYFGKTTDELNKITGNTSKTLEEISKLSESLKKSSIMTSFQYVSYASKIATNIVNLLKMFGILEDGNQATLNSILDAVKAIQKDVQEINKKVTDIQQTLSDNLPDLKYDIDITRLTNLQKSWTDFLRNEYNDMMEIVDSYKISLNGLAKDWAETWQTDSKVDLRALYNSKGLLLLSGNNLNGYKNQLPETPESSDDTSNSKLDTKVAHEIVLPAKYLTISSKKIIDADNYEELIKTAILNGVKSAVEDGVIKIDSESLSYIANVEKAPKDEIISKIADDLTNSLFYEFTSIIANNRPDGLKPYASTVLSTYKNYISALKGENNMSSAINDLYESFKLTFAFEGEAKEYASRYYLFTGMSTLQFGSLTSTLVAATPNISSSDKKLLANLMASAMEYNNTLYDNFITGNDNYCYPLKGVLNYVDLSVESVIESISTVDDNYSLSSITRKTDNISDWLVVDASIKFNKDNLDVYKLDAQKSQNRLKNSMLDDEAIKYLYHYISASKTDKLIMDYLKDNKVITGDGNHSTTILTKDFSIKDQPIDKTLYQSFPYGAELKTIKMGESTAFGEINTVVIPGVVSGYEEGNFVKPLTGDDYKTPMHTKLVGHTFSFDNKISGGLAMSDIANRESVEKTLAVRLLQYRDDYLYTSPRYLLTNDAKVTVDVSASATDSDSDNIFYTTPYRSIYTATVSKEYGTLALNYNEKSDPNSYSLVINNKSDFITFLKKIAAGNTYEGQNILLKSDIDLGNENLENYWTSSAYKNQFRGHFNGNGKTIENVTMKSANHRVALFRTTGSGAVIENLKLKNVNISGSDNKNGYAALVGYASEHLIVRNVEVVSGNIEGYNYVGGIVGEASQNRKVHILNSTNNANITASNEHAGGFIGNAGNYYVYKCINNGNVTSKKGSAGGIVGFNTSDNRNVSSFVRESKNAGAINGYNHSGGISGYIKSDDRFSRFIDNENIGSVTTGTSGYAGGIVGYTEGGGTYTGNRNTSNIESGSKYAGGILGASQDDPVLMENNHNFGNVKSYEKTGGIVGYIGNKDNDLISIINSNSNSGKIESLYKKDTTNIVISLLKNDIFDAGGIVGAIMTDNANHVINNNSNTGEIIAYEQAGGIVGFMAGGGTFDSNSNKGNITSQTQNAGGIVGKIEDDKCTFKNTNIYTPNIVIGENLGTSNIKYDYVIKILKEGMHAAKIVGWDAKRKASVNSDSLLATIFGEGNVVLIIAMFSILIVSLIYITVAYKKKPIKSHKKIKNT